MGARRMVGRTPALILLLGIVITDGAFGPFFTPGYGAVGSRRVGGHGGYGYSHHSVGYGGHHSGYGHSAHGHSSYGHTGYGNHGYGHQRGYGHGPGFFHGGPFSSSGYGYHG